MKKRGKVLAFGSADRLSQAIEKEIRKAVHAIMDVMIAEVDFAKNENKEAKLTGYKGKVQKQPCHFCEKPTTRGVKFGYCTYYTPCCSLQCQQG